MLKLKRFAGNPILLPSLQNKWEAAGAFNGSIVKKDDTFYIAYRAQSKKSPHFGINLEVSTVGLAEGTDGSEFTNHRQFIAPEEEWERFGCEDPRIVPLEGKFYIFYTALSGYPFSADNIKVAVAITSDFKTIEARHPVTPFNAKAMAMFPEKINDKYVAILTANTDIPPGKIALAFLDTMEELWSPDFWNQWYQGLDDHTLPLKRGDNDQVELGATPVKTDKGWLIIYSYIQNYFSDNKIFGIEAVLLDLKDPTKIVSRTNEPILVPETEYELYGNIPNIAFPSGALIEGDMLHVYYGAADTSTSVASCKLDDLLNDMTPVEQEESTKKELFTRFEESPIITPIAEHAWESKAVFNAAVTYDDKVHIVYRAHGDDLVSYMGYAASSDGLHIDERLPYPIYAPREDFEKKGCEDPRITRIGDRYYMCYTAYDGSLARVAFTNISVEDFKNKNWNWTHPIIITNPDIDNKDTCVFPRKVQGKYVFIHRPMSKDMWIDFVDDLEFKDGKYLEGQLLLTRGEEGTWDKTRIGVSNPPIETKDGWLLLYHGFADGSVYKVGAVLLDLENPAKVLKRYPDPIFEPEKTYEKVGQVPNVVFPCGQAVIGDKIYLYYGGADSVIGVATGSINELLTEIKKR